MHARVSWVLFALLACSNRTSTPEPGVPVSEPAQPERAVPTPLRVTPVPAGQGVEGVVRIESGDHRFRGVLLERTDGERLVLAYRPLEW
ncbi:MAG TPA: hypothetical protein VGB85_21310, partial [Nannocystis sp.]